MLGFYKLHAPHSSLIIVCLLVCLLSLGISTVSSAAPPSTNYLVHVTRLGGTTQAAQPYVQKLSTYLEEQAGFASGSLHGSFFSAKKDALAAISSLQPAFGVLEPALFFELQETQKLVPLAEIESRDLVSTRFHVVVKDAAIKNLADLKNKKFSSTLADAPAYLSRVVLDNQVEATKHFVLKRIGQPLKGVRLVLRGETDATLLDDEQLKSAQQMEGGKELRVIYSSAPLPSVLIVSWLKRLTSGQQEKLQKALLSLCSAAQGTAVCQEFRIQKIVPLKTAILKTAQKQYQLSK